MKIEEMNRLMLVRLKKAYPKKHASMKALTFSHFLAAAEGVKR
ncbi:hypothetical protein ACPOM7_07825 [Peribacillus castrilensis]|nr:MULTISPECIES: hypothetical protein [Bacillaceae]MEA3573506.1 hypothetical protein [Peribacillus frigoritolerans]